MAKKNGKPEVKKQEKTLFSVFGEFDSYMEINEAARGLLEEGDLEGLRTMAQENGLEEEAEWYIAGNTEELCDMISAALGKLKAEKEYNDNPFVDNIADYMMGICDDVETAMQVRKTGKRIAKAAGEVKKEAMKNEMETTASGKCCYCSDLRAYQIVREYYAKE